MKFQNRKITITRAGAKGGKDNVKGSGGKQKGGEKPAKKGGEKPAKKEKKEKPKKKEPADLDADMDSYWSKSESYGKEKAPAAAAEDAAPAPAKAEAEAAPAVAAEEAAPAAAAE